VLETAGALPPGVRRLVVTTDLAAVGNGPGSAGSDAVVEHVLAGRSAEYLRERREIIDDCYPRGPRAGESGDPMRVLVVTIVHHPQDARILHREIAALRAAGHEVTYAAPFAAYAADRPDGIRTLDLPRASGRHRARAVAAAGRLLRREAPGHDLVLLHDPELLVSAAGVRGPVVVWDVHEDTAAAVTMKAWLPSPLRAPTARTFGAVERAAARRRRVMLAEHGYAVRFAGSHPVVPNSTYVPLTVEPPGSDRVVYLGSLTRARGALDLAELGRLLDGSGVTLHLIGPAGDPEVRARLGAADAAGELVWHGFVPNDQALTLLSGALAGLSLLHDEPNYRHSQPTKVIEYMAHGVPVVTTPNPLAAELVTTAGCGVVVPFEDPGAAAAAILELAADPDRVAELARRGHETALREFNWAVDGAAFVRTLEGWVAASPSRRSPPRRSPRRS
jgi:glycosyltransferase involved in cell wall biosynthesis